MRVFLLRVLLTLTGLSTWKSWNGFGVTTSWPNPKCERQVRRIQFLFALLLPRSYIAEGPCFAQGGVLVVYAWPHDDPNLLSHLAANQEVHQ